MERHEVAFHLAEIMRDCWPVFERFQRGKRLGATARRVVDAPLIHWPYHLGYLWKILSKRLLIDPDLEILQLKRSRARRRET